MHVHRTEVSHNQVVTYFENYITNLLAATLTAAWACV